VGVKGAAFPSDWRRYSDASTEMEVYRLTDPAYTSALPAYYNRAVARNRRFLLYSCDRGGARQAFSMDLEKGETRQLTDCEDLDGETLALAPNDSAIWYFAGQRLCATQLAGLRERAVYTLPEGYQRGAGMSLSPDGASALFVERKDGASRVRAVSLDRGGARTVFESAAEIAQPIARPGHRQILYRDAGGALWVVDTNGQGNRKLKVAAGRVGPANWSPDGATALYLNFPDDRTQLNAIREYLPESEKDRLVAKTSQYVHFGFNRNTSVFAGASRNAASPSVLILLRINGRELTVCDHRASRPETVSPFFSPDAQRLFFQSDRDGKQALYCVHMERLVEKIADEGA